MVVAGLLCVGVLLGSALSGRELWEVGDLAGDALQARLMLSDGVLLTGHHSDVGVAHPGPAGLLLKALAELVSGVLPGLSTYAVVLVLLVLVRLVLLLWAARVVAVFFSSPVAGVAFAVVVVGLASRPALDPFSIWLHFLLVWMLPPLVVALLAVRSVPSALPLLVVSSGVAAHLHAPAFPVALLVLSFALAVAWGGRDRSGWWPLVVGGLLVVPLLARVVVGWPWPLSYVAAAGSRLQSRAGDPVVMPWLHSLGSFSGLTPSVAFGVLLVGAVVPAALLVREVVRAGRAADVLRERGGMLLLALACGAGLLVALTSFRDQVFASELLWVAGLVQGLVGLGAALLVALLLRMVPPVRGGVPLRLPVALLTATLLVGVVPLGVTPDLGARLQARHGGFDMGYVAGAADAFVASGADGLRVSGADLVVVSLGLMLELERRSVPFCLAYPRGMAGEVEQFLRRRCREGVLLAVEVPGTSSAVFSYVPPPSAAMSSPFSLVLSRCDADVCG